MYNIFKNYLTININSSLIIILVIKKKRRDGKGRPTHKFLNFSIKRLFFLINWTLKLAIFIVWLIDHCSFYNDPKYFIHATSLNQSLLYFDPNKMFISTNGPRFNILIMPLLTWWDNRKIKLIIITPKIFYHILMLILTKLV